MMGPFDDNDEKGGKHSRLDVENGASEKVSCKSGAKVFIFT